MNHVSGTDSVLFLALISAGASVLGSGISGVRIWFLKRGQKLRPTVLDPLKPLAFGSVSRAGLLCGLSDEAPSSAVGSPRAV